MDALYQGIKQLVDGARSQVLTQVNQALVLTYWHIGKAIKTQVLQSERAAYGAGVLKQLAERLTQDYGSGFSHSGLTRMAKFFDFLPDEAIVATLSQQLSWSHFVELIKLDDPIQRTFYTDLCIQSRWSVRILTDDVMRVPSANANKEGHAWGDMVVICRHHAVMDECASALARRKLPYQVRKAAGSFKPNADTIKVLTMHASKGLEFPVVALAGVGQMPGPGDDEQEEAQLFYVAATRATHRLVITASGDGGFGRMLG